MNGTVITLIATGLGLVVALVMWLMASDDAARERALRVADHAEYARQAPACFQSLSGKHTWSTWGKPFMVVDHDRHPWQVQRRECWDCHRIEQQNVLRGKVVAPSTSKRRK